MSKVTDMREIGFGNGTLGRFIRVMSCHVNSLDALFSQVLDCSMQRLLVHASSAKSNRRVAIVNLSFMFVQIEESTVVSLSKYPHDMGRLRSLEAQQALAVFACFRDIGLSCLKIGALLDLFNQLSICDGQYEIFVRLARRQTNGLDDVDMEGVPPGTAEPCPAHRTGQPLSLDGIK